MYIILNKRQNYNPQFKAQFWHSEDLKQIAIYAKENKNFDKLNQARKKHRQNLSDKQIAC